MNELFLCVIERIKEIKGLRSDAEVAKALDMTKNNLYAFKNRPSLPLKQIHAFCSRENIRIEYILENKLPIYNTINTPVNESPAAYRETPPSTSDISDDYLTMTAAIIGTPSIFATALKSNIEAFHSGIRLQQELAAARAMLTIHDDQLKTQRERLNTLEDLIRQKEDKKAG